MHESVLTMILAGGEGTRLYPLTRDRAKPAVPFGGMYRIIDFVLSNFINSGFMRIKVLTQYKSESLNKHISRGWRMSTMLNYFVESVPAQMRIGRDWFKGSADAIFQNLNIITDENPSSIVVFGADHIYKMDIRQMLRFHRTKKASCTVAAIRYPIEQCAEFGTLEVDHDWRVIGFREKAPDPVPIPGDPEHALVSMGNYIFERDTLVEAVTQDSEESDSAHDFGKSIMPAIFHDKPVFAYDFLRNKVPGQQPVEYGFWRDVGDLDTYWETSMELVSVSPSLDIHNPQWPILSTRQPYAPSKFVFADEASKRIGVATDSLVSPGCIISGGHINRTILSPEVRINSYSYVTDSVLFHGVNVGRHAMIRRAIIDKFVDIPAGTRIGFDLEEDARRFHVTPEGIVVVSKGMIIEP